MSEIKFISENRDLLIEKIDFMQNKFTSLVSEITDELRDSVSMFTERINNKLKHIEGKFSVQQEELENLKKELKSKQFDESNFNNVSMIKNQSKQIAEKELRIKELESRNKYLEDNSKISKSTPIIGNNLKSNVAKVSSNITSSSTSTSTLLNNNIENEVANHVDSQVEVAGANDDIEIEVSKDIKKTKGRIIKKKIIEVEAEVVENEPKTDVEEISKPVKKITKKPIKKQSDSQSDLQSDSQKESEKEAKKLEEERIRLENENIERQRIADEEELRLAEEAEAQRLAEEAESKAKSKISKKTSDKPADKKITKKKIEKVIEIEDEDEIPAPKVVDKKTEKLQEKPQEKVQKKENKRQVVFPDCPPNDEDLEILELDGADYYKDTTNNNVYQIINGDDRGIFLGVYDENSNTIISP